MQSDFGDRILDSITSGVIAVDREGRVVTANRSACTHIHVDSEALRPGTVLEEVSHLGPMGALFRQVMGTGAAVTRRELTLHLPGGASKEIGVSASPLGAEGALDGVIFLFVDMTERRDLERAMELNRQLASLGELAAGVVHELRNPVSVIGGMAELLLRKLDAGDERRGPAQTILNEAVELERSISQFLGLARPFDLVLSEVDPGEVVRRAVHLCNRRAEAKSVEIELGEAVAGIVLNADGERVAQALANIVGNAIDASPPGGRVCIRVCFDDEAVAFEVSDEGPGIHLDEGQSLFTPFFTTKEGGTGLGLTIVHRIVTAHRGHVCYANGGRGGAVFTMRLPLRASDRVSLANPEF